MHIFVLCCGTFQAFDKLITTLLYIYEILTILTTEKEDYDDTQV